MRQVEPARRSTAAIGQPIVIAASAKPADDGAVAEHALGVERDVRRQPEHQHADDQRRRGWPR